MATLVVDHFHCRYVGITVAMKIIRLNGTGRAASDMNLLMVSLSQ